MPILRATTKYGVVQGVRENGISVFKGIPYAAPPVGELRFRPPIDPKPWEGVRLCDTYASMAIQTFPPDDSFEPYAKDFYYMGYPTASEDCLYLNIWTSAENPDERHAVYIWFHGGGLSTGYSYEVEFNPTALVKKGIIVVQVAQRLNIFGSLALPQLSAEQNGTSGNWGLMDEIKALDWVYENITVFGGDPENITVGGQSGGTQKACVLAASPASKGRVRRVIAESGLKWKYRFPTVREQEELCMRYLEEIGVDPNISPDALRRMDAWKLYCTASSIPEQMVCDHILIPYEDLAEVYTHHLGPVDFLCGENFGEVNPHASDDVPKSSPITSAQAFYKNYKEMLGPLYDQYQFEELVHVTNDNAWDTARMLACMGLAVKNRQSASKNNMLNMVFNHEHRKRHPNARFYAYVFCQIVPAALSDYGTYRDPVHMGAYHSSELWYTFASLAPGIPPSRPWRESDYRTAEMVSSYWVNFIKTGNVNGPGLPYWPSAEEGNGWIELKEEPLVHQGIEDLERLILAYVCGLYDLNTDYTTTSTNERKGNNESI